MMNRRITTSIAFLAMITFPISPVLSTCPVGGYRPPLPPYEPGGTVEPDPGRSAGPTADPDPTPADPPVSATPRPVTLGGGTTPAPRTGHGSVTRGHSRGRKKSQGPGLDQWEYWWELNKDAYLWRLRGPGNRSTRTKDFDLGRSIEALVVDPAPVGSSRSDLLGPMLPLLDRAMESSTCDIRSSAVLALGKLREPTALSHILRLLDDSCSRVRVMTVLSLGVHGDPQVIPILEEILNDGSFARKLLGRPSVSVQAQAYAALALGLTKSERAVPILAKALNKPLEVAQSAALALGILEVEEGTLALERVLKNAGSDRRLMVHALTALGRIGDRSALPLIERFLGNSDADLARSAIIACGLVAEPRDEGIVKALRITAEEGKNPLASNWALISLGQIGGAPARKTLVRTLTENGKSSKGVFAALALGISSFDRAANPLDLAHVRRGFLDAQNDSVRSGFALALGLMNDGASAGLLRRELRGKGSPESRGHLSVALGLMDAKQAEGAVKSALEEKGKPNLIVCAARALALFSSQNSVGYVCKSMASSRSPMDPLAGTLSLGFIGETKSVDPLCKLFDDARTTKDTKAHAIRALGLVADRIESDSDLPGIYQLKAGCNYGVQFEALNDVMSIL